MSWRRLDARTTGAALLGTAVAVIGWLLVVLQRACVGNLVATAGFATSLVVLASRGGRRGAHRDAAGAERSVFKVTTLLLLGALALLHASRFIACT